MALTHQQVDELLAGQQAAVAHRTRAADADHHEVEELATVRRAMPEIRRLIGNPEVIASLANVDSKRATLLLQWPNGTSGVLKVAGCTERGEAETLAAWKLAQVPAIRPMHTGRVGEASYLVTGYLQAPTLKRVLEERMIGDAEVRRCGLDLGRPDALRLTVAEMMLVLANAHLDSHDIEGLRPLHDRLDAVVRVGVAHLQADGLAPPSGFEAALEATAEGPRRLLHGDPWVGNMLYHGGPVLIDPAGCYGPPEWDAAQAIAQITPVARTGEMAQVALAIDPSLDARRLDQFLGLFHTLEAGRQSVGVSHVAPTARNSPGRDTVVEVGDRLRAASQLLSAPALGREIA